MSSALFTGMEEKTKEINISQIVTRYGKQLFSFIRKKVRSLEDTEDILQEVWYQYSKLSNFEELENISAWLYSVSRNKITDLYRKKKPDNLEDYSYVSEEGDLLIKDVLLLDNSANPELHLFKELFWKELLKSLDELPENQKLVFVQNEIEDKSLQQIANENGENIKTIISRKAYAVKHLRKKLEPLYLELYT